MDNMRFVIITGLSGGGKTNVSRVLEDLGYFCVDNLPPMFIPKFAELVRDNDQITKVALVVDIRSRAFFDALMNVLEDMEKAGQGYELLFLEASDETIIRRYKETRRSHPLAPNGRLIDGIHKERARLDAVRGRATHIIDTTNMKKEVLKERILALYGGSEKESDRMAITVLSFGFKYGMPLDADLVFDVRFLPNPYYVEALRKKSGTVPATAEYIWKWPITKQFNEKLCGLLDFLVPNYIKEGKSQLVIAIGCTGGMHRSVFMADKVGKHLRGKGYNVTIEHRNVRNNDVEEHIES